MGLRRGGFSQEWVKNCLQSAIMGYCRRITQEIKRGKPINRPASHGFQGRLAKKITAKSTWFKKKPGTLDSPETNQGKTKPGRLNAKPESVIFVPHTPNGELRKSIQKIDEKVMRGFKSGRVKVVEKLGNTLINTIGNQAPWRNEVCSRPGCKPCKSKPGSCLKHNVTYSITCNTCLENGTKRVYWGETSRSWWDRCLEHETALRTGNTKYAIVKHQLMEHADVLPNFSYKVDKTWKTALERQVGESILIDNEDKSCILNSRSEWGHNAVPRLTITRDNQDQPSQGQEDDEPNPGAHTQDTFQQAAKNDNQDRPHKRQRTTREKESKAPNSELPADPDPGDPGGTHPGPSRTLGTAAPSKAKIVPQLKRKRT